jgi:hypothetical protein
VFITYEEYKTNYEQYLIDLKAYNEGELEEQPVEPELYNTYLIHSELVDITPYIAIDLISDFINLDSDSKNRYLFLSSKLIDKEYLFKGYKYSEIYPLKFPRLGLLTDNEIIPLNVKIATVIRASQYYNDLSVDDIESLVKKDKIGRTVEREYFNMSERDIVNSYNNKYKDLIDLFLEPYIKPLGNICRS